MNTCFWTQFIKIEPSFLHNYVHSDTKHHIDIQICDYMHMASATVTVDAYDYSKFVPHIVVSLRMLIKMIIRKVYNAIST